MDTVKIKGKLAQTGKKIGEGIRKGGAYVFDELYGRSMSLFDKIHAYRYLVDEEDKTRFCERVVKKKTRTPDARGV